jgi:hypothetical protein
MKAILLDTDVLVLNMLQKFQFAIRPFAQYWSTEWFHNLLNRNRRPRELILC